MGAVERGDAVRAALAELGADAASVLVGKYVDGHSVNELARASRPVAEGGRVAIVACPGAAPHVARPGISTPKKPGRI